MPDEINKATPAKASNEYSGSQAREVRKEAEEPPRFSDERLIPGGAHGSHADVGMSGIERDELPSGGRSTGQERYGDAPAA